MVDYTKDQAGKRVPTEIPNAPEEQAVTVRPMKRILKVYRWTTVAMFNEIKAFLFDDIAAVMPRLQRALDAI